MKEKLSRKGTKEGENSFQEKRKRGIFLKERPYVFLAQLVSGGNFRGKKSCHVWTDEGRKLERGKKTGGALPPNNPGQIREKHLQGGRKDSLTSWARN